MSTRQLRVVGMDPSMRNWGICQGTLLLPRDSPVHLEIDTLSVICPVLPKGKQTRQNSLDLEAARQLAEGAIEAAQDAEAIFVEVPVGSQSARAMASYGICVGVLGALRAQGIPFFEVTPTEVKLASVGIKTATKQDMIAWARRLHPHAQWPLYLKNGVQELSEAKAEHMADAIAAIYAGLRTNTFRQTLPILMAA